MTDETQREAMEKRAREVLAREYERAHSPDIAAAFRAGSWTCFDHPAYLAMLTFVTEAVAAERERAAGLEAEIVRLRGLLIDPGDPAWEDARAVLVVELDKAEMPNHARAVANGDGAYIPSWMTLNLIAQVIRGGSNAD